MVKSIKHRTRHRGPLFMPSVKGKVNSELL